MRVSGKVCMKRLLIVGAGGFGREVLSWASDINRNRDRWEVGGFLDSNPTVLEGFGAHAPIVGDPLTYIPAENDLLVCAIGDPQTKLGICRGLKERGGRFFTLIHPTAVFGLDCKLGEGCLFCPGAVATTNVTLGDFVALNVHATVGHDAVIGEGCTLNAHCDVTGGAILGEGVFLGSHAVILPGATVGEYAVVGAGSVVLKSVRPRTTVVGVPARVIYGFDD